MALLRLTADEMEKAKIIDKYRPILANKLGLKESEVFPRMEILKEKELINGEYVKCEVEEVKNA
jgi:hypothetical protein